MRRFIESVSETVRLFLEERRDVACLRGGSAEKKRARAKRDSLHRRPAEKDILARKAEDAAVRFFRKRGYTILARNYRSRYAEIDIIAQKDEWIVFVEVKARSTVDWGQPFEAVDAVKRKKIIALASSYISSHRRTNAAYRFDIISIRWDGQSDVPLIDHYENAFDASGE